MERKIQFYQFTQPLSPEMTLKLGQFGKIVGIKPIAYQNNSYLVEFHDNIRIWLFKEELKCIPEIYDENLNTDR